jgi:hypothetical protein
MRDFVLAALAQNKCSKLLAVRPFFKPEIFVCLMDERLGNRHKLYACELDERLSFRQYAT